MSASESAEAGMHAPPAPAPPHRRDVPTRHDDIYRVLVDAVVDYAIFMLDEDGRVTTWNSGARRLQGYTADEAIGQHLSIFFTEEDIHRGAPPAALEAARREGRFETEGWRVRKDGSRFWALAVLDVVRDPSGRCIGFAEITRDMTERKLAQEHLLESERRFGILVQGVTDYAIFMLDPAGRVANWNSGAAKMKGYAADEIIGQHFSLFYTDEDLAADLPRRVLEHAAATGRYETEGWRKRKDGGLFWANVVIDAIFDDNGELAGFAKVTRDITERREAQREMEEIRAKLVQAQKLEALGQLTGGIAHDFNNLLQAILGGVQLLQKRADDKPFVNRTLEELRNAALRGATLTRQLLAFSRQGPVNVTSLDLKSRLSQSSDLMRHTLRGDIDVELQIRDDVWPVRVDEAQFELALLNVAVNARDAMPQGGRLIVTAENRTLSGEPDGLHGRFVAISLRDRGEGIPAEVIGRVFEPFFTTKPIGKGTGLGLSQAYGFARQTGGTVTIASEPGAGTEVVFFLPSALDDAARPDGAGAAARGVMAGGGASILIVDDDIVVGRLAAEMLRGAGYRATVVDRPQWALELLERGDPFDAVVSDVIMPGGMSGIELAREIRRRQPRLPVLLATGFAGQGDARSYEFPVLLKPFATPELTGALWPLIAGSRHRGGH